MSAAASAFNLVKQLAAKAPRAAKAVGRQAKHSVTTKEGLQGLVTGGGGAPWVVPGAAGLNELVGEPLYEGVRDSLPRTKEKRLALQMDLERRLMLARKAQGMRVQRLERDMGENLARLAAVAPELYNRVLAGRRLPQGAVVIGGQPRTDLLQELAMRMADGEFQPAPDPLEGLV